MFFTDDAADTHFAFEETLPPEPKRKEKSLKICRDFQNGKCHLGDACPQRHVITSRVSVQTSVCKHWLRGACVNGENCLYLHEYVDRFVPQCAFYERIGECTNPECPFTHARPQDKMPECAAYRRGFCPMGPRCELRHVQHEACPFYLAGFCPLGPRCPLGHPIQELYDRASVTNRVRAKMLVERADDPTFNRTAICYRAGCHDPGHLLTNCPGPQHSVVHKHLNEIREPGQPIGEITDNEIRGGQKRCFLCHQEGHQVKDCPKNTRAHHRSGGGGGGGGRYRDRRR